jgi:predicted deacylase
MVYGTSFDGWPLRAYRLGYGPSVRVIIGGIHGGYEWNTVSLVSDTLAYLQAHPEKIPSAVTLYLIPCANPDGYRAGTDAVVARMNGNGVDLNRNWDYRWQTTATHGRRPVNAGAYPFSEPETAALRDFILRNDVELALLYHSALDGVIFSSQERARSATYELAEMLAPVVGYRHRTEGIPGQVTTGDAIDWLSVQGIAAVELELTTHQRVSEEEWRRNLRGILAFLRWPVSE